MSRFLVRLALSAGICLSFASATPAAEQATSALPPPSEGHGRILAALVQPTEFDFQNRPLGEVLNYFKQKHAIEILMDSTALSRAGIDTDRRVTQTLRKITLRAALRLLLRQFDSTYVVGDGYLLITSAEEAESKLNLKVYPVQDLITLDSEFRPAAPIGTGIFLGLNELISRRPELNKRTGAEDFESLISVITSTIAPDAWEDVGGPGSITAHANSQAIAISQTDDVHEEIVDLLAALRRVRDAQIVASKQLAWVASPEASDTEKPLQVHAYRLMRGSKYPPKSGWRPPQEIVGDSTPPRRAQQRAKKSEATSEPSSVEGGAATQPPANEATAAKEGAAGAPTADKGAPAKPSDAKLEAWVAMIAKLVPEMIEPTSWEPTGEGMIRAVGEAIVVRNTEEIQHRVARLMAELLPDYVPVDFTGPWGPWKPALLSGHAGVRLRSAMTGDWPQQAEPRPCGEEARAHEALLEQCGLDFDELPLIDALSRLADLRQVQLFIDRQALIEAGVKLERPVTHSLKGLSYGTALRLLLDEYDRDLTYLLRDGILLITTKTEAENMLTVKVYPVFDLVVRPPNAPGNRPGLDFQPFMSCIQTNIAPDTWVDVGGPSSIEPFVNSGALVISQTTSVHQEIAEYLKALRAAAAVQKRQPANANPK